MLNGLTVPLVILYQRPPFMSGPATSSSALGDLGHICLHLQFPMAFLFLIFSENMRSHTHVVGNGVCNNSAYLKTELICLFLLCIVFELEMRAVIGEPCG